ncbi:hypothetical protein A4U49_07880 [Acidithiobacillus ferrivorans]|uniref:DUF2934 domain-containing protein n=1 Tax=Acidithiobacillus ferrivorans TaxID=160808 RepID=UPI0008932472|nr:DUF2934 domain-containing protein [Acidithiobacillus ferrivorans]OFA16340.1 hypothetical protein A4U49_07880 [Acidithiobacillus ferrivorans]
MSEENQEVQHHQVVGAPWVPAEARYCMIAEAAYFIAERGGFEGNCEAAHWLEAEREIDRILGAAATTDSAFFPD